MTIRPTLMLAALLTLASAGVHAQPAAPPPLGQNTEGMTNMPGMAAGSTGDMTAMMRQCAQMEARMKAGMKMAPDMQPMMDRCNRMDRSMGAAKTPDDTLSR